MAKVTFRRGDAQLYKERWEDYNKHGNQEYSYLANAIYFAEDTHELFLDGNNYTFDSDVDFDNIITEVEYNAENNTLTIDYSDVNKASKVIQLTRLRLKNESGPLKLEVVTETNGQKYYELDIQNISEIDLSGVAERYVQNDYLIENGDTIADAFSKMNDSMGWIEVPDDEVEEPPISD